MRDRLFYPLAALLAGGMIALGLVWPQGEGTPSPAPFGHPLAPMPAMPSETGAGKAVQGASDAIAETVERKAPVTAP